MEIVVLVMLFIVLEGMFFSSMTNVSIKKRNVIFAIILFLQLFIPAGLRNIEILNDTQTYADHFQMINPQSIFQINPIERFEAGYQVFENFVFLKISHETVMLLIISSFIIQLSYIIFFFKYSNALWFTVFLYFGLTHYFFVVSGIRQGLAIGIYNFAVIFLINKRWIIYSLITLLAAQFHSSAYLLLLIPLIDWIKLTRKTLFIYLGVILACFLFLESILDAFFSFFPTYGIDYMEKERISESKTGIYLILITYLIGLIIILRNFDFKQHTHIQKIMFIFYLALIMFLVLSIKISILVRFTHYFIPFSIVMLSNSCSEIKSKINRFVVYLFWVLFLTVQMYVILLYRPEWFTIVPYKFYWEY